MKIVLRKILVLLLFCFTVVQSYAWVYPEHRRILLQAIQNLSPEQRKILDQMWANARVGYEGRLTESIIDVGQGVNPTHIDYAAWAAISGDHSCSPKEMLEIVLKSDWILNVAHIAAQLEVDIKESENRSQHINDIRNSDIRLQRADDEYATRAGSNNVHFLLARPDISTSAEDYFALCHASGSALNALGMYSWFHTSALYKAARARSTGLSPSDKSSLILAALADEAFALHFLEDVFASGHTAGTWGAASVRKGTHDYYNEKGLEVTTWDGERLILLGDAFMRPEDSQVAALTVAKSVSQLVKTYTGEIKVRNEGSITAQEILPDTFNVCKNNFQPHPVRNDTINMRREVLTYLPQVLRDTPVPGLAVGIGEIPRFRSELGMFYGLSSSVNMASAFGGFGTTQNNHGFVGGLEANVRFGLGLDGVLNQAGDGLVFLQLGLRQDASSSHTYNGDQSLAPAGAVSSAIPARAAWDIRFRMPFWVIPGDLVLVAPIVYLFSPKAAEKMGVAAVNGGAIPWQAGIETSIGRFQFVLGREIGLSYYGTKSLSNDAILVEAPSGTQLIGYSSIKYDFPFLEYRPLRTFSMNQSSSLIIQFTAGVDVPRNAFLISSLGTDTMQPLKPVWFIGARIVFDWRKYF